MILFFLSENTLVSMDFSRILSNLFNRIKDYSGREGASGGHLAKDPAQS